MVLPEDFGPEDLDHAPARQAADAERDVEPERAGGNGLHLDRLRRFAQPHDRALAERPLDLGEGGVERFRLVHGGTFDDSERGLDHSFLLITSGPLAASICSGLADDNGRNADNDADGDADNDAAHGQRNGTRTGDGTRITQRHADNNARGGTPATQVPPHRQRGRNADNDADKTRRGRQRHDETRRQRRRHTTTQKQHADNTAAHALRQPARRRQTHDRHDAGGAGGRTRAACL